MKFLSGFIFSNLFIFFCHPLFGQQPKSAGGFLYPEFNLRTSLTSWFDYDAGLMLGVGYRWNDRFALSVEPTWVFYSGFEFEGENRGNPSGVKLRADLKYYVSRQRKKKVELFIGPEFHYKNVRTKKEGEFGINCTNGQCAFFQQAIYTQLKKEWGAMLKLGLTTILFSKDRRWLMEFYTGIGGKSQRYSERDIPIGGSFIIQPSRSFWSGNQDTFTGIPIFPGGIKLVFLLERK